MDKNNFCPICGQPIPSERIKEIEKKYAEEIKKEADKKYQERLEKETTDLEKKLREEFREIYAETLDKKDSEISKRDKELERIILRNRELERALQRKTPDEFGDEAQENLLHYLREAFSDDEITKTQRGKVGADIFHKVKYKNQTCGLIIYEVKNVKKWQNKFIEQASAEKTIHGTPHVLLVTNVFPANENDICRHDGIMVVSPSKVKYIAGFIRKYIVEAHKFKLSQEEQGVKEERLYEYLTSEGFKQDLGTSFRCIKNLRKFQDEEIRVHNRTWAKQRKEFEKSQYHLSNIEGEITAILEEKVISVKIKQR